MNNITYGCVALGKSFITRYYMSKTGDANPCPKGLRAQANRGHECFSENSGSCGPILFLVSQSCYIFLLMADIKPKMLPWSLYNTSKYIHLLFLSLLCCKNRILIRFQLSSLAVHCSGHCTETNVWMQS